MRPLVLALACGCGVGETPGQRTGPEGPDALNGRLAPGASLCEYEDVAPAFPPPDETGDWLEDGLMTPYLECSDGAMYAGVYVMDAEAGREVGISMDVQLFQVVGAGGSWLRGEVLDPLEGLDDCSVTRLDQTGTIGVPDPEITFQDSPELVIRTEGWERTLVDYNPGAISRTYSFSGWLDGEGELPPDQAILTLDVAEGGSAPPMVLDDVLQLPSRLEVTEPDLTWEAILPREDVTFRWTGASDGGPVELWLFVRSEFNGQDYPMYEVVCEVADDGEFVLPGSLLTTFPAGWSSLVEVRRTRISWIGTVAGRAIRTYASSRHFAHSVLLGE
jgi:hypothetical protein